MKLSGTSLRYGYTTGSCATAAAKAALQALITGMFPEKVKIFLPDGSTAFFLPEQCRLGSGLSRCCVRKDAGDDPDVTNGLSICCEVETDRSLKDGYVVFLKGPGVGEVTLPGLGIDVGEPAVNPVPREMIRQHLQSLLEEYGVKGGVRVRVSVPGGEEVALKTLNRRVGVRGGISIIGTSGRVVPYSEEAFIGSIARMVQVARQNGTRELVVTAGIRSENMLKPFFPSLPDTAFIHYGNRIGSTLELILHADGFDRVTVGVMLAKATKLAQGELDLSSRTAALDREFITGFIRGAGYGEKVVRRASRIELVRSLVDIIPFCCAEPFYRKLAESCRNVCRKSFPAGDLSFVLISMNDGCILCDEHGCQDMERK